MAKVFGASALGFFLNLLVICDFSNCIKTEKHVQYDVNSRLAHFGTLSALHKLREKRQTPDLKNQYETVGHSTEVTESPSSSQPNTPQQDQLQNKNVYRATDDYDYYNSTRYVSKEEADNIWDSFKNITPDSMLSESHRKATTVGLSFDFPFYGHPVRNITIATGGFLYTGEYVHSWLAATQYIAPLMANFDASLGNDSYVRYNDNGTAFTVIWEKVLLQDNQDIGKFSFSTSLHQNGDIIFVYLSVPINIKSIEDDNHPVKIGLSDAYVLDKAVFYPKRKTIYEYHRISFANVANVDITNSTIIYLKALPTCIQNTDCGSCLSHKTPFDCNWCPALNRCSSGNDRGKQEWLKSGCDRKKITTSAECPLIEEKDNDAHQPNPTTSPENAEPYILE